MRFLSILIVIFLAVVIWNYVNSSVPYLSLVEVFPFSKAGHHDFTYNWTATCLILLFLYGAYKITRKGKHL